MENNVVNKKIKRLPFIIIGVILVCGIIIGSFYDLEISKSLFVPRQWFCIFLSVVGMAPSYYGLAFIGGVLTSDTIKRPYNKIDKIALLVLAIGMSLSGIYLEGDEISSINGFNFEYQIFGLIISLIFGGIIFGVGYLIGKKNENRELFKIIIAMALIVCVGQVFAVQALKLIMHRPRFRAAYNGYMDKLYYEWYRPFNYYVEYTNLGIGKEEFRSFPSGHAAASFMSIMFLCYLPYFFDSLWSKRNTLMIVGTAWYVLISISRIIVGAHYLSDVCFGGLISFVFFVIGNYILEKKVLKI